MNITNKDANINLSHFLMDILLTLIAYILVILVGKNSLSEYQTTKLLVLSFVHAVIFLVANKETRIYDVTMFYYFDRVFKKVTRSFFVGTVLTCAVLFYFVSEDIVKNAFLLYLVISYILLVLNAFFFHRVWDKILRYNSIPRTAFVGKIEAFNKFFYFLNKTNIMLENVGFIYIDEEETDEKKLSDEYIGKLSDLEQIVKENRIDQIYILQKRDNEIEYIQKYIDMCIKMGVTCRVIVDFYKRRRANSFVSTVGTYPVITYHTITLNSYATLIKRIADIIFGAIGIILSSPILLVTAIAIKIDSPGPVLFKQTRVGQNGRLFKCLKFRSMYIDAEERKKELMDQNEVQGLMFKMKDDPRVTRVGKFIRKCSIDELPQFFNVFLGTMSLVGTRPPTVDEVEQYEAAQWRRISIKPGITGMWQVNGRSNVTDFDKVVQMDVDYIDNWSLMLDIKIIFKTFLVLLGHDGAY